ncbi:uncharacterized protein LOC119078526 [Bradysia coprophila]|uniref:uncharacterized protein LOC119078526 n=1 Tax=Bradysia coprophila TaxID=38358 RepID=UPI00187DA5D7|nr:uncharacterized protein LOC119078526 [Bradysia coprophila]
MTSTSDDAKLVLPIWLNNQFIEEHLQQYFQDDHLKVLNFVAKPATEKVENFAGILYRLTIKLNKAPGHHQSADLSIIAKLTLRGNFAFDFLSSLNAIEKEFHFYSHIAPKMKKCANELMGPSRFLPEVYGVCEINGVLLLEDLAAEDYCTISVQNGYDLDAAKVALQKVAAFHAINALIVQREAEIFESYGGGIINQHVDGFLPHFKAQVSFVKEVVSNWPDFAKYLPKLDRLLSKFDEKARHAFQPNPTHFNTLVHGDMWSPNLMVRRSEDKQTIDNIVFIDFQFSCFTSPAIDLHYFLSNTLKDSLRLDHTDELIEFYHTSLVKHLENLNYSKRSPTLQEFKQQFAEKGFYGFMTTCLTVLLQTHDYTESVDFETIFSVNEKALQFKRKLHGTPKAHAILRKYLPYFDELGVLD